MGRLRTMWARLKGQAAQSGEDEAFADEIREHIALLTQHYLRRGMSAEDAALTAHRQFGNITQLRERQRWQRGMLSPAEWWRDVHFGVRMLAKKPGLSAAMILALTLGVGANTTVFSIVDAVLLRPLPYAHPERLMDVRTRNRLEQCRTEPFLIPTFLIGARRTTASLNWSRITTSRSR